ncbi:MAG: preprotein translocase subunit YajC, partial [Firmicutes bacterium]|nr:preprotein translocase subunit YajC [Bacillota bacterium]
MSSTTYTFVMMIFIIAIFWLILIRPQRKREKQVNAMRSAIKAGDKIVTIGGTKAKVLKAKEESLIIEAGPNVRMEVMRWAVSQVLEEAKGSVKNPKPEEKPVLEGLKEDAEELIEEAVEKVET